MTYDFPDDDHGLTDREADLLAALRSLLFATESAANLQGLTVLFPHIEKAKAVIAKVERSL